MLLERAAAAICDLPGLERWMVFQREGGVLHAVATVFADHSEWAGTAPPASRGGIFSPVLVSLSAERLTLVLPPQQD